VPISAIRVDAQRALRVAEAELAAALTAAGVRLDDKRRCEHPKLNLVETVSQARWSTIAAQLDRGNGSELDPIGGHRPKFCSAFSSCALAVNTFGLLDDARPLSLPGIGALSGIVEFEAQRSAVVRGYKPNLDLVAEPPGGAWLFAESKCLEYLRAHNTDFSDAFVAKAAKVLTRETAEFFATFAATKKASGHTYELLDAAQLLKHFLAAKRASAGERPITLAYVYWEPADAADHQIFVTHRAEADQLSAALTDEFVRIVPLSYRDLWDHWDRLGDAGLAAHADALRARYDVTLGSLT
jgi:hypothetical protein